MYVYDLQVNSGSVYDLQVSSGVYLPFTGQFGGVCHLQVNCFFGGVSTIYVSILGSVYDGQVIFWWGLSTILRSVFSMSINDL